MQVNLTAGKQDVEGVWATIKAGVRLKVARAGNTKYLDAVDKLEAPFRKQIRMGKLSTKKQIDIQCRAMAQGLLVDWEGLTTVQDGNEVELPYTEENAFLVLRHNTEIRDFVFEFATEAENYRTAEKKATAKKS